MSAVDSLHERRDRLSAGARRLDAELRVLELYDLERGRLGYDYGSGQRSSELGRRRRGLEDMRLSARVYGVTSDELEATRRELAEALGRVSGPRIRRLAREHERQHITNGAAERGLRAWRATAEALTHP